MTTSFAELDLAARTDRLEKAVEEIRKIGDAGERTEQRVKKSTESMAVGFGRLAGLLGGVAAGFAGLFSAATLARGAQDVQAITNGFLGMGQSAEQAAASLRSVADIAERTRAPLTATAELYRRVSVAAGELGASQADVGQFTQNIGMALAASGTSAAQASGALLQLSQAMAGGVVRAEEFNSILEGAFPIAQAAARGLDAAGGSVGRLRQLVVDGKVSSEAFFNAILSQSDAIEQAFGRTVPTVSQAMTDLNNSVSLAAAQFDSALGLSASLAQGLLALSDGVMWASQNTDVLRVGFEALAVAVIAFAATQIPALTVSIAAAVGQMIALEFALGATSTRAALASIAMKTLQSVMLTTTGAARGLAGAMALAGGPFGLLLGILGGAAAAMVLFRDNTGTAAPIIDEAKDAVDRINAVLANSSEVALPAAARATLNLTNENIKLAKSAYAAAEAEVAKATAAAQYAQTELGLQQAFSPTGQFTQAESDLAAQMTRLSQASAILRAAQEGLNNRINEGQLALSNASAAIDEHNKKTIELKVTQDKLVFPTGGGAGDADPFQQRLEALQNSMMTEREVVDAWYQESMDLLADRRAMELLGEEEHKQSLLRVEEEYQRQLAEIKANASSAELQFQQQTIDGALGLLQQFGAKSKALAIAGVALNAARRVMEIRANTAAAIMRAYAELGPIAGSAAAARIGAMGAVQTGIALASAALSLGGGGGSSGGGGGGGGSAPAAREATPERAAQQRFLRIEVQGDGMFADMLRNNVQSIADAIVSEQRAGGTTILVGR